MPYRFRPDKPIQKEARRIAKEQLSRAIDDLSVSAEALHTGVHEARKRLKKLRALLRLLRPNLNELYQAENAALRDAARRLSDLRDAEALIESLDLLAERYREELDGALLETARRALRQRREAIAARLRLDERAAEVIDRLGEAKRRVKNWSPDGSGFDALTGGLQKTYRRARRAMNEAYDEPADERFHEWRKRVKYHRYHVRMLRSIWEPVLEVRRDELKTLTDRLGDDHDLVVLRETIRAEPGNLGDADAERRLLELIDRRSAELRAEARPLGARLFAEKPRRLAGRFERYWQAAASETG
ncbi:MAG: CHAD domain-containing protein [Planctomycetota bacterium]|nr:CHAD domain-containing protein [Planctomycetota bacterium]